jgi:hypothetical protein
VAFSSVPVFISICRMCRRVPPCERNGGLAAGDGRSPAFKTECCTHCLRGFSVLLPPACGEAFELGDARRTPFEVLLARRKERPSIAQQPTNSALRPKEPFILLAFGLFSAEPGCRGHHQAGRGRDGVCCVRKEEKGTDMSAKEA